MLKKKAEIDELTKKVGEGHPNQKKKLQEMERDLQEKADKGDLEAKELLDQI